ncbi:MAG: glycine zipper 2TM domain-containing protein [Candidatus Moranbacteria bacterium]|nr:glycine zipper 2TM domain-containing protein [Candidatus Moranbacteria bacterium]
MKSLLLVLFSVVFSIPAFAASASFTMEGQVTRIEPRVRHSTTYERECWTEEVPVQQSSSRDRSYGGAAIGGVTGGILGHQIGKGSGKTVATATGAVIGALVGDNIDNDGYRSAPQVQYRSQERCRSVPQSREIPDGYDVTVRFQGRDMTFQMRDDPGYGTIRLNFSGTVTPARW